MATPENPRVRLNTRTLGPLGTAKVTPFPARSRCVQRGSLGPRSRIRARKVAGNSNLRFGDTPGPLNYTLAYCLGRALLAIFHCQWQMIQGGHGLGTWEEALERRPNPV